MAKKVLLVEDDKDFSEAMQIILENEGFFVTLCSSLKDVWNIVKKNSFDIAVMDYHLPDGEGTKIVQKLMESENTKNIPVLLMSADSSVEAEAKDSGVRWFMPKPLDFDLLLKRIKSV